MKPEHESHDRLEQLVTRLLQEQPLRRAPDTLVGRVLAQVEQRATSRWRRGFAHWPIAARVAFIAASVGFVKGSLLAVTWLTTTPLDSTGRVLDLMPQVAWLQTLLVAVATVVRSVPPHWIHVGIAVLGIMYVALFGIGATVYRTVRAAH